MKQKIQNLSKLFSNKKSVYITIALLFFLLVMMVILVKPKRREAEVFQVTPTSAVLSLDGPSSVNADTPFTMTVMLDTSGENVDATDVLLTFNNGTMTLTGINPMTSGCGASPCFQTFMPVENTTNMVFDENRVITSANNTGLIEFGALAMDNAMNINQVSGSNVAIAELIFTATATGDFDYTFTAGSTVDSNVVTRANDEVADILDAADQDVEVTVAGASTCIGDVDGNGAVNILDLREIVVNSGNWNQQCP
jgi:hypothetical protein